MSLNYAVFLFNIGDKKKAAKQFSSFDQKIKGLKGNANPANSDPEVGVICIVKPALNGHSLIKPWFTEDRCFLTAYQKYCRKLPQELSAILLVCIKVPPVYKNTSHLSFELKYTQR